MCVKFKHMRLNVVHSKQLMRNKFVYSHSSYSPTFPINGLGRLGVNLLIVSQSLCMFRFSLCVAGCEDLFRGADGGTKNQTYVGVLAKL